MPTFNHAQLAAFLSAINEPAQLYDVRGNLVAENALSSNVAWPDTDGDSRSVINTIDLGEGWFLRCMAPTTLLGAPTRLIGPGTARPNMQALMSGITHELRNPLAAILTAASLLNDDKNQGEETTLLLGVVRAEARRMASILTEFSLYVKSPPPQPVFFDFNEAVQKSLNELREKGILGENLKIENRLPEALMVYADPLQMQQVLMRLLENAAHALAAQSAGMVRLLSYEQADTERVVICIEDNGPGFNDEEKQRAFTPFYSTKPQATGLGLPIVQTTVQAAGGAIWIENHASKPSAANASVIAETSQSSSGARVCFAVPQHAVEF